MMEFEEQKKKAEASGGPSLLVGYDKLLYMSELQAVPGDDEYGNQDLDAKFTKFTHLKTEHITRLKREVIEILSSCEGNCLKLSQFKSRYHKRFGKKFNECYRLLGGRKEFCNLMAELDIIEFDQNGSRPLMKLKEPQASQHMSFNVAGSEHSCATDVETRETRRPRFVKRRETVAPRFQSQNTSLDAVAAGPIIARVPTVPLAPLDQNVSDSRVQSPALETTFQASPLVLSTSLMRGPSHTLNIPEGM